MRLHFLFSCIKLKLRFVIVSKRFFFFCYISQVECFSKNNMNSCKLFYKKKQFMVIVMRINC